MKDYFESLRSLYIDTIQKCAILVREGIEARKQSRALYKAIPPEVVSERKEAAEKAFHEASEAAQAKEAELAAEQATAPEKAAKIRKEAAVAVAEIFAPSPAEIDFGTLELLKAGILTDAEIIRTADKFKDNITMKRLIARYIAQRTGPEVQALAAKLSKANGNPFLLAVDEAIAEGERHIKKGVRHNPDFEPVEDVLASFDNSIKPIKERALEWLESRKA